MSLYCVCLLDHVPNTKPRHFGAEAGKQKTELLETPVPASLEINSRYYLVMATIMQTVQNSYRTSMCMQFIPGPSLQSFRKKKPQPGYEVGQCLEIFPSLAIAGPFTYVGKKAS